MQNCEVFCCISGSQHKEVESLISHYKFITILESTPNESHYENLTLKHLYNSCRKEKENFEAVCYFHTKGVRHFVDNTNMKEVKAINGWRLMLEYGVLERWTDCIQALQTHDVAGINYHLWPRPHFQGNFWWATSRYISSLEAPDSRVFADETFCHPSALQRVSAEMWLGSKKPTWFSLYNFPFNTAEFQDTFDLYQNDIFPHYLNNSM